MNAISERRRSIFLYAVLAVVFAGSLVLTWFLKASGFLAQLAAMPAVIALIGALYKLALDEAEHQKRLELQHDRQTFELGATSHMANVAFDKHVLFCEEYVAGLHETLRVLMREGTSANALVQADKLVDIQRRHSVWVTPEIELQLNAFDLALRKIGSTAWLYGKDPGAANRSGRVLEMHRLFADVVGLDQEPGETPNKEIAIATILERARAVLGVRQLIELRHRLLELRGLSGDSGPTERRDA
jgi:hypothetical protein